MTDISICNPPIKHEKKVIRKGVFTTMWIQKRPGEKRKRKIRSASEESYPSVSSEIGRSLCITSHFVKIRRWIQTSKITN